MQTNGLSHESACEWLRDELSRLLGTSPAQIDLSVRFRELGLVSLQITELLSRLSERVGFVLPTTLAWEHPTPSALAQHLAQATAASRANVPTLATTRR